ncbi:hypothetical protein [Chryseobacterium koreense]|uniref:Uncharacterized protein n=1 Tax=Chryseobacterium koreense CCUG 49689 TaxID=1304281 RepID=A0A0J7IWQ3_9FLAO|nr:hypothetical protein [Chryseobacterium koreense]KMQ70251.1 hypothetical protein ACM44_13440 [Chryseobacterium koreense CCUG 49689]MBB5334752.1 hypothetical protein [Chryseobacterium koreense]
MAVTPLNIIYSWFETGDYPTEQQFQATWQSFWHKSESIPMSQIGGLNQAFNSYVTNSTFNSHLNDPNAHAGVLIPMVQKGAHNGVATLNDSGKIPESQLPSYVDDVLEGYLNSGQFFDEDNSLIDGEKGKIYVDLNTNKSFRWSGSVFVDISSGDESDLVHITGDEEIIGYKQFLNEDNWFCGTFKIRDTPINLSAGFYGDESGLMDLSSEYSIAVKSGDYINFAGRFTGTDTTDGLNRSVSTGNYGLDHEPGDDKLSVGGEVKADGFKSISATSSTLLDHESLKLFGALNQRITHKFNDSNIYTIRYGAYDAAERRGIPATEDRGCDILRFNLTSNTISVGATQISAGATTLMQPVKMKLHYTPETANQDSVVTIGSGNLIGKKPLTELVTNLREGETATGGVYEYRDRFGVHELPIFSKKINVLGTSADMPIGNIPISVSVFTNMGHIGVSEEIRSEAKLQYSLSPYEPGMLRIDAEYVDELGGDVEIFINALYAYAPPVPERLE